MSLTAGSRLGGYEILGSIGKGGMGEVYRARDTALGRDVAIKVLRQELAPDPERLRRFELEARSASALNHPNIVHIYLIGEHEGSPYIAMEYVEGRMLREVLRGAPLATSQVVELTTQIASALAKAHSARIVHRDLKPENLMVASEGYVKILDFGLAKLLPEPARAGSEMVTRDQLETRQGVVVGTVQYMSPEQAMGHQVDARSDQFSLGSILYEMATGKLAFQGESLPQTMAAIIEDAPEPIQKINPRVPTELSAIVERCLHKDPAKRYATTEDLMKALKSVPETSPVRRSRQAMPYGAAALVVTALALGLAGNLDRFQDTMPLGASGPSIETIAVLPLHNVSGDPEQDYLADGLTEALITDLAKIGALKVISRTSAMRFKGSDKALSEIASELDVDAVLEGSALRAGDRVRITAQLIDVATDQALWAQRYERDFRDLLLLQGEVARAVAREVEVAVTPEETRRLARAREVDPEAHEAYLKGRSRLYRLTPEDVETARQYFELAIEKDSEHALAYAGLARVWGVLGTLGVLPGRETIPEQDAALQRAIELDDGLAEAHGELANLRAYFFYDWGRAEIEFQRAIELNPSYADARFFYGLFLTAMKRPLEASAQMERGLALDPFNPLFQGLYGQHLLFLRRYDDAIAQFRDTLRTTPEAPLAHNNIWQTFHQKGMYEEALAWRRKRAGRDPALVDALEQGYAEAGYRGAHLRVAELMEARSKSTYVDPIPIAGNYTIGGDNDRALFWLERAYEERKPDMVFLGVRPIWDPLRTDPLFQDLLRRMKLPM